MLLNRQQARLHLMFAMPVGLLMTACIVYYALQSQQAGRLLGGGSGPGLLCGIAAGGVIIFEMLLWPRKAVRRLRLIPAKYWLAAHVWFGLASLPLAIVHSGFHLGGWLPTWFMFLFVMTILSGLYGMAVQNILPRWMLRNLPAETIYNQIDFVSARAVDDLRQLLMMACGPLPSALETLPEVDELAAPTAVVVGAVRSSGRTRGRTLETRQVTAAREDRQSLWNALREIEPFLLHGAAASSPVTDPQASVRWMNRLRDACGPESSEIIELMEGLCLQRRQFDTQQTVHRWLHAWLPIHIGLSVAVTVLLAAHVWTALKYW